MKKAESRGSWYLLTGLVIGLLLGIVYSRNIQPVSYIDTSPSALQSDDKDRYRALIASAYLSNGDLVRARARLELLNDHDVPRTLTEQAQRILAAEGSSSEAQALGILALALGQDSSGLSPVIEQAPGTAQASSTASSSSNSPTPVNSSAASAEETLSPDATIENSENPVHTDIVSPDSFVLTSMSEECNQKYDEPLIVLEVSDQTGNPVSGILATITWSGGEDSFYTGLKPEKGLGYADYTLKPDFVYSLYLGETGATLRDIRPVLCQNSEGDSFWGVLSLKYSLPQ